jgi:hypothetical protein
MSNSRALTIMSSDEIAQFLGHEWVQHPEGYSVYVPDGGKHFFDLIAGAIARDPEAFVGSPLTGRELFECLNAGELAKIVGWLHETAACIENSAHVDRGRDLPLYGWALAKQRVALEYLWLRTDEQVVDNPTQRQRNGFGPRRGASRQ